MSAMKDIVQEAAKRAFSAWAYGRAPDEGLDPRLAKDYPPVQGQWERIARATISPEILRVLNILRNDWWGERSYNHRDWSASHLLASVVLAFKDDIHTVEKCNCELPTEGYGAPTAEDLADPDWVKCDECLRERDVPGVLAEAQTLLNGSAEIDCVGRVVPKKENQPAP